MSSKESREHIHLRMSKVAQKDTVLEIALRRRLHTSGLRFRKNVRSLPGAPDIVFESPAYCVCRWGFLAWYDIADLREGFHHTGKTRLIAPSSAIDRTIGGYSNLGGRLSVFGGMKFNTTWRMWRKESSRSSAMKITSSPSYSGLCATTFTLETSAGASFSTHAVSSVMAMPPNPARLSRPR